MNIKSIMALGIFALFSDLSYAQTSKTNSVPFESGVTNVQMTISLKDYTLHNGTVDTLYVQIVNSSSEEITMLDSMADTNVSIYLTGTDGKTFRLIQPPLTGNEYLRPIHKLPLHIIPSGEKYAWRERFHIGNDIVSGNYDMKAVRAVNSEKRGSFQVQSDLIKIAIVK